jgi:phosphoglycerate kinase
MAFTFSKALGGNIGASLCEDDMLETAKNVMAKAKELGVNIVLPTDCVAADKFAADAATQICSDKNVPEGWMGLDLGPESAEAMAAVIKSSKTILWNGPAGVFELAPFQAGTKAIAHAIADATANGAFSLIGGGDSVAAINQFGLADKVSYVSTGGGALLEMIEGKDLPGVAAIRG